MIAILLVSLAVASAAPQFGSDRYEDPFFSETALGYGHHDSPFNDDVFDTKRFWQDLETEMHKFDQMLTDFYKRFPMTTSQAGVQGNEYVVTQSLSGFDEKDIKVKAREGVLMIQAVHKIDDEGLSQRSYLDLKTLPSNVNVNGTWTFENGVLRIVFPLKSNVVDVSSTTEEPYSPRPTVNEFERSGEEMETKQVVDDNQDADVGLNRNTDELLTNVIPRQPVEATTYAVDLNNEVEFVPVNYY